LELKAPGPPGLLNYNLHTPRQNCFFLSSSRHECAKRGTFQVSIEPKHHRTLSTRSCLLFRHESRCARPWLMSSRRGWLDGDGREPSWQVIKKCFTENTREFVCGNEPSQ
jgi:arginine/ornithine N-succinyltransferase beta subunit